MQLGNRYGDLFQMSYVTRDMDAALAHCRERLGLDGFQVSETGAPVLCNGRVQELRLRAAVRVVGRRQIEILEPLSGPTHVYTDAVDLTGSLLNFHHIAIRVRGGRAEWEALLAEVRASGDEVVYLFPAEPCTDDKVRFCYVDTRAELGHHTEFMWWDDALTGAPAFPDLD
jgi:hypothetical protein